MKGSGTYPLGQTRNLTSRFVQLREQSFHGQARARGTFSPVTPDDKRRLLPGDSSGDVEAGVLRSTPPPAWVELHQELLEEMERAQRKIEDLKKLHRQHLLPGFDEDDRYSEEQQIDKLAREIAQSLQSCDQGVKQISVPGAQRRLTPQEAKVRSNAQTSLATRLHAMSRRYRKQQDSYISKLEKQQGGGDGGGRGRSSLSPFDDDDSGGGGAGGGRQVSQQVAKSNEEEIRYRDGEISKVARSVQEIATLMQDLSGLVIDQGTKFDRIDYNIEQTVNDTADAVKQLQKAEHSQKKSRLMNCILCLLVMCSVMVVILFLKVLV